MKYLVLIYFSILVGLSISCQVDNRVIIKPGIGVDNITFADSDIDDIKQYLNGNFKIRQGTGHADGIDWSCYDNWTEIKSENLGLTFIYSTPCVENPDTLEQNFANIRFVNTPNCCLENGICIGITTYNEVKKIYGLPSKDWMNESFLRYKNPTLELNFDSKGVLSEIKIYRN